MKSSTAAALGLAALLSFAATPSLVAAGAGAGPEMPTPSAPATGSDESMPLYAPFVHGDQTLSLAAGVDVPLFISVPAESTSTSAHTLYSGGLFSFSYQYFLTGNIAIGGTIDGAFNGTIGGRTLFMAPLSFRGAYWWNLSAFEICAAVEGGAYLMSLDSGGSSEVSVDPFAKVGGGAFWRVSRGWSVGLQSYFWFLPEFKPGGDQNLTAYTGILEVSIAAFYHL